MPGDRLGKLVPGSVSCKGYEWMAHLDDVLLLFRIPNVADVY